MAITQPLLLNQSTDWNYQKIFLEGIRTSTATAQTITINHGLGYEPNVRAFVESFTNNMWPANTGGAQNIWLYDFTNQAELDVYTTTTQLVMTYSGPVGRKIWYRIYFDG